MIRRICQAKSTKLYEIVFLEISYSYSQKIKSNCTFQTHQKATKKDIITQIQAKYKKGLRNAFWMKEENSWNELISLPNTLLARLQQEVRHEPRYCLDVVVRLFRFWSQMKSKCSQKNSGIRSAAQCSTDVLNKFLLWLITEQTHGNTESICFIK